MSITAKLAHARKRMRQRMNKPMAKHANETLAHATRSRDGAGAGSGNAPGRCAEGASVRLPGMGRAMSDEQHNQPQEQ